MSPSGDPELLDRARRGDRAAFQALVRPHLDSVRRFAFSFCGSWSDADDLTQEVLLKAYRSIGGFEGRASLSTWLYTLARSVFIDARRGRSGKMRDREDVLDREVEDESDTQEHLVVQKNEVERLWRAVRRLDPEFRIPVVLCDIEGMSYEHVASVEQVPIGTVRSRLSRGRAKLAEMMAEGEPLDARERSTPRLRQTRKEGQPHDRS